VASGRQIGAVSPAAAPMSSRAQWNDALRGHSYEPACAAQEN
jgi:hypothetical protein